MEAVLQEIGDMEITTATLKTILSTANTTQAIAGYIGLIESLGVKIDRLASAKLDMALRELVHARNADSDNEKKSALRSARAKFSEALSLERKAGRRTLAFLGLAMCLAQLGEKQNFKNTLLEFCLSDSIGRVGFFGGNYNISDLQGEIADFAWKEGIFSKVEHEAYLFPNRRSLLPSVQL